MKYCYQCGNVTAGEPLFCNSCGRSYDVKLCPRLHANPRNADVCSSCGSRDLSTPQPRVPVWVPILQFFLSLLPGAVLAILSVIGVAGFLYELAERPAMLFSAVCLLIALGILWWLWARIPLWLRTAIYRRLRRKRSRREGNGKR
jgi:hypothetical protein